MAWLDNSGLYQKYGLEQTVPMAGGEYCMPGEYREISFKMDLTKLGTASANVIGTDNIFFPKGFRVEEIKIEVETAATGSGAVFNLGLMNVDRSTAIDADGLLVAVPQTALTPVGTIYTVLVGDTNSYDGALMGTDTAAVGQFAADYDTAAFTAGVIVVRVKYRKV